MTLEDVKCAIGDLARPAALIAMVGAVFLAVALNRSADVVGALCLAVGGMYGARAAEQAIIGRSKAKYSVTTP